MTRIPNLSNTQSRYQLVFFVHIYGYIWLAEGCLWHLLPRQNMPRRYVLTGSMILLIQRTTVKRMIVGSLINQMSQNHVI